jgi:hypothetical protein
MRRSRSSDLVRLAAEIPAGELQFTPSRQDRLRVQVRAELSAELVGVFRAAVSSDWSDYDPLSIADGRGGSVIVTPARHAPRILVRRYLRGGLPAYFVRDIYLGIRPRPFRELRITQSLYERGAPVAEPYGAAVQWLFPGCYRGWLATCFIDGARTLWKWLRDESPTADERRAVLEELGEGVRCVRRFGVRHEDLNLHNILICGPSKRVVLIDFDRAHEGSLAEADLSTELARLRRSARKLDPQGKVLTEEDLLALRL